MDTRACHQLPNTVLAVRTRLFLAVASAIAAFIPFVAQWTSSPPVAYAQMPSPTTAPLAEASTPTTAQVLESLRAGYQEAYNALPIDRVLSHEQYAALFVPLWQQATDAGLTLYRRPVEAIEGFTLTSEEAFSPGHALFVDVLSESSAWCIADTEVLPESLSTPKQREDAATPPKEFALLEGQCTPLAYNLAQRRPVEEVVAAPGAQPLLWPIAIFGLMLLVAVLTLLLVWGTVEYRRVVKPKPEAEIQGSRLQIEPDVDLRPSTAMELAPDSTHVEALERRSEMSPAVLPREQTDGPQPRVANYMKMSGIAVAGFVVSLLAVVLPGLTVLGIALCSVSFVQIREGTRRGKSLAWWGIGISSAVLAGHLWNLSN